MVSLSCFGLVRLCLDGPHLWFDVHFTSIIQPSWYYTTVVLSNYGDGRKSAMKSWDNFDKNQSERTWVRVLSSLTVFDYSCDVFGKSFPLSLWKLFVAFARAVVRKKSYSTDNWYGVNDEEERWSGRASEMKFWWKWFRLKGAPALASILGSTQQSHFTPLSLRSSWGQSLVHVRASRRRRCRSRCK